MTKDKTENFYTNNYYALKTIIVLFYEYLTCYIKKSILRIIGIQVKECYDTVII